jgi:hypothetical protein
LEEEEEEEVWKREQTYEDAQSVLLGSGAEEAHEHRHFCMSYK